MPKLECPINYLQLTRERVNDGDDHDQFNEVNDAGEKNKTTRKMTEEEDEEALGTMTCILLERRNGKRK